MTKSEKLRAIIHKDVSGGFMYELEKQLRGHSVYLQKLNAHPNFISQVISELVEKQLTYYETVSDSAVDKAYDFFMSDAGAEWCLLSSKFVNTINEWVPRFIQDVVRRLDNLN